jgi:serine protease Do
MIKREQAMLDQARHALTAGRRAVMAGLLAGALAAPLMPAPVLAQRGPEAIADVTERVMDAVVNISTTQRAEAGRTAQRPQLPPGSPFEEFFEEFFNRRGQPPQGEAPGRERNQPPARRQSSLGSGFVIDFKDGVGTIITNNHVIDGADEITAVFNDGTKLTAELIGRDQKVDIAVLRVRSEKPLRTVRFADSDRLRIGQWVIAIGNPFGLGGTVTAGIVSARNRDIQAGPYDNFIQTDASINRGNSGGPLFNLDGEVVGINTAIISPSGGSIGIGFAVPAATALPVIDQLRNFGETRRGWLGVRIQGVTDEIAESLNMGRARGALIAGIDDKGPAKPAGIEPGDVVLSFDGKDVREMRDLPRIVADTPVGKTVDVVVLRKGKEQTLRVTVARLEETPQQQANLRSQPAPQPEANVVKQALGMDLSPMNEQLRQRYKIKESVKGVVVTGVDANSVAAERRIQPGEVIVEVAQEPVASPADIQKRIDQLKKDGRRSALMLVSTAEGEVRFVAVSLQ